MMSTYVGFVDLSVGYRFRIGFLAFGSARHVQHDMTIARTKLHCIALHCIVGMIDVLDTAVLLLYAVGYVNVDSVRLLLEFHQPSRLSFCLVLLDALNASVPVYPQRTAKKCISGRVFKQWK